MAQKTDTNVFTAPLGIIKLDGIAVGKLRTLNFTENVQRGEVQGIGDLTLQEVPPLSIKCQFTADSYLINMDKLGDVSDPFWPTQASSITEFVNSILLGEVGVDIYVYSKIPKAVNGKIVTEIDESLMGVAANCFLNSRSIQIQEAQVAGKNVQGVYLEPIMK